MRIITYDVCESTNTTLRELLSGNEWLPGGTVVRAVTQTRGRGQRGNTWEAEPGMNLTFSMILRPGPVEPAYHFIVSEAVALGVANFLMAEGAALGGEAIEIKWPNDILAGGRKIAGILLENTLGSDGTLLYTIAGIGININQTMFTAAAPNATSLSTLTGIYYDLDELMEKVATLINLFVDRIAPGLVMGKIESSELPHQDEYHELLWRRKGMHRWLDAATGETFEARIERVATSGHLELVLSDNSRRRYLFKEVFPA